MALSGIASFYSAIQLLDVSAFYGVPQWVPILGYGLFLIAALSLGAAYALWMMQTWGFDLTIFINMLNIIAGIALIFVLSDSSARIGEAGTLYAASIVDIVLSILIMVYLFRFESGDARFSVTKKSSALKCPKCGKAHFPIDRNCLQCGYTFLQFNCPKCYFPNFGGSESCQDCGHAFDA
jgi:predicted RNA-binding Zn-ribbon protein involved in translation (DUF1610 family)